MLGASSSPKCSLNGVWDAGASSCSCRPAWKGPGLRRAGPAPALPGEGGAGGVSTWKEDVLGRQCPAVRGRWALPHVRGGDEGRVHVDVVDSQQPGGSRDGDHAEDPSRSRRSCLIHSITIRGLSKTQRTGLLFMIGGPHRGTSGKENCSDIPPGQASFWTRVFLYREPHPLNGPWSAPIGPLVERGSEDEWDYVVTNPSSFCQTGQLCLFQRNSKYWHDVSGGEESALDLPESVGVARAPHWSGPYEKVFKDPISKIMNEDPFARRDSDARWRWFSPPHSWTKRLVEHAPQLVGGRVDVVRRRRHCVRSQHYADERQRLQVHESGTCRYFLTKPQETAILFNGCARERSTRTRTRWARTFGKPKKKRDDP